MISNGVINITGGRHHRIASTAFIKRIRVSQGYTSNAALVLGLVVDLNNNSNYVETTQLQFLLSLAAYLSSYHEKAIKALSQAHLGVAGHLSTTPRRGNPAECLPQWHNK